MTPTDNEIKEVLGWWSKRACKVMCPKSMTCEKCVVTIIKQALDLINRLQSKNKELDEKNVLYKGLIDRQKAEIERLNSISDRLNNLCTEQDLEIERLKAEIEETNEADREAEVQALSESKENAKLFCEAINHTKTEAIKEFWDKLKQKAHNYYPSIDHYCCAQKVVSVMDGDNLVKEMEEVNE